MSYFRSKKLLAAKALAAKDWSHPSVIIHARRMAHEGASTIEIRNALWPSVTLGTANRRLKKFNITSFDVMDRAHRGFKTGFPTSGSNDEVNQRSYRPKIIGVAP